MHLPSEGILAAGESWLRSPAGVFTARIVHGALTIGTIAFVARHLWRMGPETVLAALPRQPAFYLLFVATYLLVPVSEYLSYRLLIPRAPPFPDLLRKRAFNDVLFDYSGEAYLLMRARAWRDMPMKDVTLAIKDVTLLSGLVSNSATLLLLVGVMVTERGNLSARFGAGFGVAATAGTLFVAVLVGAVIALRKRVITVQGRALTILLGIHAVRVVGTLGLQMVQWSLVLPAVGPMTWLEVLAVWMLVTRIPFVPNRDLLLVGIGLSLSALLAAPQTAVAGLFLAAAAIPLLTHLVVLATGVLEPRSAS